MDAWFTIGIFGLFTVALALGGFLGALRDRAVDADARRSLTKISSRRSRRHARY